MKKVVVLIFLSFFSYSNTKYINKKESIIQNEKEISQVYELKNKEAKDIKKLILDLFDLKVSYIDNSVLIIGHRELVNESVKLIKEIDKPNKQVLLKIWLIDTSKNLINRVGLNWKLKDPANLIGNLSEFYNGKIGFAELLSSSKNILDIDIDMLKRKDELKIKLMPYITVIDSKEAILRLTDLMETFYNKNVIKSEAGLILSVLPKVKYDYVELDIKFELSSFKAKSIKRNNYIQTIVNIKNNTSIIIGGVNSSENINENSKIPYLSDIPIINRAFRYKTKNNLERDMYIEVGVKII